jgi:Xaa-Pro aminopeptidase
MTRSDSLASRREKLASVLAASEASAYFAATPATMGYFHGLSESGGERLLTMAYSPTGACRLIAPALAANQARRHGIEDIRPWADGENPLFHLRELGRDWGLEARTVAVDDDAPAYVVLALQESIPGVKVIRGHEFRTAVMAIKEEWELDLLAEAGRIADAAFQSVLGFLQPGLTEAQVADFLSEKMAGMGGKPTFAIVAAGPGAAEPHHESSTEGILQNGQVIIMDFGCTVHGYHSDITRTVALGDPGPLAQEVYALVLGAHHAARAAIAPGVPYQEVDRAARAVIAGGGYAKEFCHRTGHGIGLNIHESPNVVEGETRPLLPGACFSVEPGIYLEGQFGVRIENIVAVTEDGHRSFNADPPDRLIQIEA